MTVDKQTLIALTADIVSAHVQRNTVAVADLPAVIDGVYGALAQLGAPAAEPAPEKPKAKVSARASIKADHLVSMIDGKSYKTLKRHIGLHGYTPESYRQAFDLPADYPMISASYAATRRAIALNTGLGTKPVTAAKAASRAPRAEK